MVPKERDVELGQPRMPPVEPGRSLPARGFSCWPCRCWKGRRVQVIPTLPDQDLDFRSSAQVLHSHHSPVPRRRRNSVAHLIQPFDGLQDRKEYERLFTREVPLTILGRTIFRRERVLFPALIDQLAALKGCALIDPVAAKKDSHKDKGKGDPVDQASRDAAAVSRMIGKILDGPLGDESARDELRKIRQMIDEKPWTTASSEDLNLDSDLHVTIHVSRGDPARGVQRRSADLQRSDLPAGLCGRFSHLIPPDLRERAGAVSAIEWLQWAQAFGFSGAAYAPALGSLQLFNSIHCGTDICGAPVFRDGPIVHADSLVHRDRPGADNKHGGRPAGVAVLDSAALLKFLGAHPSRQGAVAHAPQDDAGAVGQVLRLG